MKKKISFIGGCGSIGFLTATLVAHNYDCEILIIDKKPEISEGYTYDLSHSLAMLNKKSNIKFITEKCYSEIKNSDIVVITAGTPAMKADGLKKTRDEMLNDNKIIIKDISKKINEFCPDAFIVVVTNPLDIICSLVLKECSNVKHNMIVGMAGILDSSRLKYFLSDYFNINYSEIDCTVIGEHGDTMVPVLSNTKIKGINFYDFIKNKSIKDSDINSLTDKLVHSGFFIGSLTGKSASVAPSFGVFEIIKSYLDDLKKSIPCSVFLNGQYGVNDMFLGTPCIIGANGVEQIIEMELDKKEKDMLKNSIAKVQKNLLLI